MTLSLNFRAHFDDGLDVIKANPVPCLITGCLLAIPVLNFVVVVNFMAAVKASRQLGQEIDLASVIRMDRASDALIALGIAAAASIVSSVTILGPLLVSAALLFAPCLLADKPGLSWKQSLNGSLSFALACPLDMLLLALLSGLLATAGALCVVGFIVSGPVSAAMVWMAYEGNKARVEATSAARGVSL